MVAANLNFDKENTIDIGASFKATIQLCDAPNLLDYQGRCDVRANEDSTEILLQPSITIANHDTFNITIPHTVYNSSFNAGNYRYDVLFYKTDDRFFAIRGTMAFVKTITKLV